jgi:hypothetical protein
MPSWFKLPLRFDPVRLRGDLAGIPAEEWTAHYNRQDYAGEWGGVALRSVGGVSARLYADPAAREPFADTPLLARCPYFQEVLGRFQCPLQAVRLLRLRAGARIREHRDFKLSLEDGDIRLHIPILTNPDVHFVVNGERLVLNPGETWYINFNLPHRVANRGTTDRVHLVLDCQVNDWLRGQLPAAGAPEPEGKGVTPAPALPCCREDLERFRLLVWQDPLLHEELCDILDRRLFIDKVVSLGAARGCGIAEADLEEAMRAGRRSWLERWIQ